MTAPAAPAAALAAEASATAATAASARTFYAALAALSANTARNAAELFLGLDPAALAMTWSSARLTERLFVATSLGQTLATDLADRYVSEVVAAQGVTTRAQHALEPQAFAGVASDGRDLESLLETPLGLTARTAAGREPDTALQTGASALATIVETQVSDAGRAAAHTAITARREVSGYVRMLTPPSCGRCAILAGRTYRWSAGFARHPRCDCVHIPAVEDTDVDLRTDPEAYFRSLDHADQARYFGAGAAEAIRAGGDMGLVVNASRPAKRAGLADPGRRRGGRVMPGELLERANGDRTLARRLLERHGYIR